MNRINPAKELSKELRFDRPGISAKSASPELKLTAVTMVLFFTSSSTEPPTTLYMGKDKEESKKLIDALLASSV